MSILNVNSKALKAAAEQVTDISTDLHKAIMDNWTMMAPTEPAGMDQGSVLIMENCNNFAYSAKNAIAAVVDELGLFAQALLTAADSYLDTEARNALQFNGGGGGGSGD